MRILSRLLAILSFFTSLCAVAEPIRLAGDRLDIGNRMEVLIDAGGNMTIEQAMQADTWSTYGTDPQYRRGRDQVLWLKIVLQSPPSGPRNWWLEVQLPAAAEQLAYYSTDTLRLYVPQYGHAPQPVRHYRNPVFQLTLPDAEPSTVYLRVDTGQTILKRIVLWQPAAFLEGTVTEELLWGMRIGIVLLLAIAGIWFERAIRDGVYLSFSAYLFSVVVSNLMATGIVRHLFGADYMETINMIRFISAAMLISTSMDFMLRFLGLTEHYPRPTKWFIKTIYALVLMTVVIAMAGYFETAIAMLAYGFIIAAPTCLLLILRQALQGDPRIGLPFLAILTATAIAIVLQFLASQGHIRVTLADYSTTVMSTIICFVIFYVISKRHRRLREANEQAQGRILDIMQHAEQELEQRIENRTKEMQQAMNDMQLALSQERAAQEEQRQFVSMVSHELRAPLAIIDAAAQNLAREAEALSARMPQRLEKILRASQRLSSLFSQYLENGRLSQLGRGMQTGDFRLRPLLEDAIASARPLADRHAFQINDRRVQTVRADADVLRLVLGTLVGNAVKYSPAGSRVTLQAETVARGWHLDVIDEGPGIAAHERTQIFERHYRGGNAAAVAGSGLGLSLARFLVERQGGTLTLPDTQTVGATFRIFLPH